MLAKEDITNVIRLVDKKRNNIINFLREMIRIPSLSGQERDLAEFIAEKMEELGFDKVELDELNNVIGIIRGEDPSHGQNVLFNGHLDHVPEGEMEEAYSGRIMNGQIFGEHGDVIYGRGSCDMKGALASMIMAGYLIKECDIKTKGDVYVTGSVMEEKGGSLGTKALIEKRNLKPHIAIIGEPTNLNIAIGHRGVSYLEVIVRGKSAHASNPDFGINAIYKSIEIIEAIQKELIPYLPKHSTLGKVLVNITNIFSKPGAINVIPYECTFQIDTRFIPNYTYKDVIKSILEVISKIKSIDSNLDAKVQPLFGELKLPSGEVKKYEEFMPAFFTDPNDDIIKITKAALRELGVAPEVTVWNFATDAGWFSKAGIKSLGIGPGDEKLAHTSVEHIRVDDVLTATKIYVALAKVHSEKFVAREKLVASL